MQSIIQALWRNQGQVLTPEMIHGLVVCSTPAPPPDLWVKARFPVEPEDSNGIVFDVERLASVLPEVSKHHVDQWNEVEGLREELRPNYDYMLDAERNGRYVLFTARRDGVLIGNTSCYLYDSLHTGKRAAKEDTMYVVPSERRGMMAVRFFRYCERQLVAFGAREITVQVKTTNRAHKLWERQGYQFTDRVLSKLIERDE